VAGGIADAFGLLTAPWVVAALTAASGIVVALRMYDCYQASAQLVLLLDVGEGVAEAGWLRVFGGEGVAAGADLGGGRCGRIS
jgi:hypothetical protein